MAWCLVKYKLSLTFTIPIVRIEGIHGNYGSYRTVPKRTEAKYYESTVQGYPNVIQSR
jgi:hypothetical protein